MYFIIGINVRNNYGLHLGSETEHQQLSDFFSTTMFSNFSATKSHDL